MKKTAIIIMLTIAAAAFSCKDFMDKYFPSKERKAIESYDKAVGEANLAFKAYEEAITKTESIKLVDELKKSLDSEVIPKLDVYVKKLEEIKIELEDLANIHRVMIEAEKELLGAMKKYSENLAAENFNAKTDELQKTLEKIVAKEEDYRTKIEGFYNLHNFNLDKTQ
ncbi:MAG: hypothetical protein FJ088_01705 [Deltaproteobacteria bacterium]|nr:hypothetical protein [Deltaproteobacteria bacterium]